MSIDEMALKCSPTMLMGMRVIAHHHIPDTRQRMVLRDSVPVSDEFRAEFNKWLEDFFGREPFVIVRGDAIMASPRNVAMIRAKFGGG